MNKKLLILIYLFLIVSAIFAESESKILFWDNTSITEHDNRINVEIINSVINEFRENYNVTNFNDILDLSHTTIEEYLNNKHYDYIIIFKHFEKYFEIKNIDHNLRTTNKKIINIDKIKVNILTLIIKKYLLTNIIKKEIENSYFELLNDTRFIELKDQEKRNVINKLFYQWYDNPEFLEKIENLYINQFNLYYDTSCIVYYPDNTENIIRYADYIEYLRNRNIANTDEINSYYRDLIKYVKNEPLLDYLKYIIDYNSSSYYYQFMDEHYENLKIQFEEIMKLVINYNIITYLDSYIFYVKEYKQEDLQYFYKIINRNTEKEISYNEFLKSFE